MDHDVLGDDVPDDRSIFLRLRSTADLVSARRQLSDELARAGVRSSVNDDTVLAVCELLTNALEAADDHSAVTATVSIGNDPARRSRHRRIEVDIINIGEPMSGRVTVDPTTRVDPRRERGRGLILASRVGGVVVEGLVGGTRARFRRTVIDAPVALADHRDESDDDAAP